MPVTINGNTIVDATINGNSVWKITINGNHAWPEVTVDTGSTSELGGIEVTDGQLELSLSDSTNGYSGFDTIKGANPTGTLTWDSSHGFTLDHGTQSYEITNGNYVISTIDNPPNSTGAITVNSNNEIELEWDEESWDRQSVDVARVDDVSDSDSDISTTWNPPTGDDYENYRCYYDTSASDSVEYYWYVGGDGEDVNHGKVSGSQYDWLYFDDSNASSGYDLYSDIDNPTGTLNYHQIDGYYDERTVTTYNEPITLVP